MEFETFKSEHDLEYTPNRINEDQIDIFEDAVGVSFGRELRRYVVEYGYLAFGPVEFYGINSRQMLDSDMVKQSVYLHKYFAKTKGLIAFENQGDGDYYLVDGQDHVFEYDSSNDMLIDMKMPLLQYVVTKFQSVK